MSVSDPIADYLTCIRNAMRAKKKRVDIPASNIKRSLTEILQREQFVRGYKIIEDSKQNVLRVYLSYSQDKPVIHGIERLSTPGRRRYVRKDEIPRVLGGLGIAVISTSSGVMTGREARRKGLGGELLCRVW